MALRFRDRILKKEDLVSGKPYHCWDRTGDYYLMFCDHTKLLCGFPWRIRSFGDFRYVYPATVKEPICPENRRFERIKRT